jgi:lysophospholipase L1-like esterase
MKPLKYWTPEGFEISSYKWNLSEKINKSFKTSGSDNTGLCIYTYNELGFRGDSITKDGFKIMSIGDSNTEGVGVNYNDTWASQLCNLIPNSVNQNFGMGGRSNDYISRCLLTYYDIIKPDLVLIMYTSPQRREIYTKDNNIEPFMPTEAWGYLKDEEEGKLIQSNLTSLQNNNEDFVNWYKNHFLIKLFLESKKCNWLWNGWMEIPIEFKEFNRFDSNYGNFLDKGADGIHPGPKHNKFYGINLFNHIYLNFREFLDKDLIIKQNLI